MGQCPTTESQRLPQKTAERVPFDVSVGPLKGRLS